MTALLSIAAAAEHLDVSERTIYDLLRAGRLRGTKVGSLWRIRPADLEAFLAAHENAPRRGRWPSRAAP